MQLHVCSAAIGVVVEANLVDDFGTPAQGLFRPGTLTIALDVAQPPTERRFTLVHELAHAYEYLLGRVDPTDDEGRQNRIAAIERQFSEDLARYGGEHAIHALFGQGEAPTYIDSKDGSITRTNASDDDAGWPTSVSCSRCHEQYPGRAVRNGEHAFDPRLNSFAMWRVLICGKCNQKMRWRQRCTHDGLPLPVTVSGPTFKPLDPI